MIFFISQRPTQSNNTQAFAWSQSHSFTFNERHLFMSPVISDPKTTFLQVIPYKEVAKCILSFHNLTSSLIVEVSQLRKIKEIYLFLGKNPTKNRTNNAQREGLQPPQPLPPPPGSASAGPVY